MVVQMHLYNKSIPAREPPGDRAGSEKFAYWRLQVQMCHRSLLTLVAQQEHSSCSTSWAHPGVGCMQCSQLLVAKSFSHEHCTAVCLMLILQYMFIQPVRHHVGSIVWCTALTFIPGLWSGRLWVSTSPRRGGAHNGGFPNRPCQIIAVGMNQHFTDLLSMTAVQHSIAGASSGWLKPLAHFSLKSLRRTIAFSGSIRPLAFPIVCCYRCCVGGPNITC